MVILFNFICVDADLYICNYNYDNIIYTTVIIHVNVTANHCAHVRDVTYKVQNIKCRHNVCGHEQLATCSATQLCSCGDLVLKRTRN